jgi:hypothetical protein
MNLSVIKSTLDVASSSTRILHDCLSISLANINNYFSPAERIPSSII